MASLGDLNSDGRLDLVATGVTWVFLGYDEGSGIAMYDEHYYFNALLGNGDGSFRPAFTELDQTVVPRYLGDFNTDGRTDVAYSQDPFALHVRYGNGDGTFQDAQQLPASGYAHAVADFNRDGKHDLLLANGWARYVLLSNGDGTFHDGDAIGLRPPDWHREDPWCAWPAM